MKLKATEATKFTPAVRIDRNCIRLIGRSLPENVNEFYTPLINYTTSLKCEYFCMDMLFEYFNTATSKKLMEWLKLTEENLDIENLHIIWKYEEGDDDTYEMGKIYQKALMRASMEFEEVAETALTT